MYQNLIPDKMFNTYRDVTPAYLKEIGVSALLMDIDNTFAPYEVAEPDEQITNWIAEMKAAGVALAFVSNNNRARVELFNRTLGLPYWYKAGKPGRKAVRRALDALHAEPSQAAILGDQLLTDAYAGKRMGLRALIVPPIKDKTNLFFKAKRLLERPVIRRYRKLHAGDEVQTCTNFTIWRQ